MKKTNITQVEKYFRRYLAIAPLGLALWRTVEAKHLGNVVLKKPVLDIGCGFGEFALAYADEPIDMGIDTNSKDLYTASKTNKYHNLTLGDARKMPFTDNSYNSIFSISTLEHITHPELVLQEAYRVLKPGGVLFLTLETNEVDKATFYRPLFKKIGMKWLSNFATQKYNSLFHRHTLLPKKSWIQKVQKTGFEIEQSRDIISHEVTKLFDIYLCFSWTSMLFKPFTNKRHAYRLPFVTDLMVKKYLPLIAEDEKEGTNLLIVARKPSRNKVLNK